MAKGILQLEHSRVSHGASLAHRCALSFLLGGSYAVLGVFPHRVYPCYPRQRTARLLNQRALCSQPGFRTRNGGRPTRPDPTRPKHCCHYTRDCSAALACCTTCPCCSCTPRLLATTRRPRTCMLRPDAHWHQHGDREVLRSGRKRSLFVAVLLGCRSAANAAARFDAPSTTAADARPSVASHSAMA